MKQIHSMRLAVLVMLAATSALDAQTQPAASPDASQGFTVFLRSQPVGREDVAIVRNADGWIVRGANRLNPPLDVVTRVAEIHYTPDWRPTRMTLDGQSRGQELTISTTFADGKATNEITVAGKTTTKVDAVAPDSIVLPNGFLGSYAVLARRLVGQKTGAELRGYIAPQADVSMRISGAFPERIETPRGAISATRYALTVTSPPPTPEMTLNVWIDPAGALLRFSMPSQMLEVAREDVASAATRTSAFSLPGDESVRIPASGFGLAATIVKPAKAQGRLPAVILVGGSGPTDRDGFVFGIPVLGQIARDLSEAGFLVVRYDKRGVGQSGGRAETSTIADFAEDVRAIYRWLDDRPDVDEDRIAIVGHSEGAWVTMTAAAREDDIAAIALIGGAGTTGSDLVLEQQRDVLERAKTPEDEQQAKIALQKQINSAVLKGAGWEGVPDDMRRIADTPWFQSFLAYDPARVMRDVEQPVLIVQAELDTQVRPHHGERLAELARARNRKVPTELTRVPGVNHLLVPAKTGEVSEYTSLSGEQVSPLVTSAISSWLKTVMPPSR